VSAAAAASVAQFIQGDRSAKTSGTGSDHSSPNTDNTIGGTHNQCMSLLVGFAWLAPYSPSQSVTVRIIGSNSGFCCTANATPAQPVSQVIDTATGALP